MAGPIAHNANMQGGRINTDERGGRMSNMHVRRGWASMATTNYNSTPTIATSHCLWGGKGC